MTESVSSRSSVNVALLRVKVALNDVAPRCVEQVSPVKVVKHSHEVVPLEYSTQLRVPAIDVAFKSQCKHA